MPCLMVNANSWTYDDGMGGSYARFNIDLYYCGGGCDEMTDYCGVAIDRLCEVLYPRYVNCTIAQLYRTMQMT